jgi:hypothetical protein
MLAAPYAPSLRLVPVDDIEPAAEALPVRHADDVLMKITPETPTLRRSSAVGTFATNDDRRIHPRQALSLRIRGRRMDHDAEAQREPFLNLNIGDVSVGGIRASSQSRVRVGERVAVYFPPTGGKSRGWDAYGRVIRVEQQQNEPGCMVAVSFDMPMAA